MVCIEGDGGSVILAGKDNLLKRAGPVPDGTGAFGAEFGESPGLIFRMAEEREPVGRCARVAALVIEPYPHPSLTKGSYHLVEMGEVRVVLKIEVLVRLAVVPLRIRDYTSETGCRKPVQDGIHVSGRTVLEHVDAVRIGWMGEPVLVDRRPGTRRLRHGGRHSDGRE